MSSPSKGEWIILGGVELFVPARAAKSFNDLKREASRLRSENLVLKHQLDKAQSHAA